MAYNSKYTASEIGTLLQNACNHLSLGHATTKSDVDLQYVTNDAQVKRSEMGVANGVATLNEAGTIPLSQLPYDFSGIDTPEIDITSEYPSVDLQLPSGRLWADRNVGASSITDYGEYFQWGDIAGYKDASVKTFNWDNYKYCSGTETTLTKYNTSSAYGTVDSKTTLESSDDAATQNMGTMWRMPDKDDLDELLVTTNCTSALTIVNGVKGWLFTSVRNGNTLFFPAAGYYTGTTLSNGGKVSCVWARTIVTTSCNAYYLYGSSSAISRSKKNRYYGFSIRGVK